MQMSLENTVILNRLASKAKVDPVAIAALIEVESGGVIFVRNSRLPLIRWEGHYFYRLLSVSNRARAVSAGLASKVAGRIHNPSNPAERYRVFQSAIQIDPEAAYASISFGVGQIMGANFRVLGYELASKMYADATQGFFNQLIQLLRFIRAKNLIAELNRRDWRAFARGYNGPAYEVNGYHIKLAQAYDALSKDPRFSPFDSTDLQECSALLRLGSRGARVRELQTLLSRAGARIRVDGDFGPLTKRAVQAFQSREKLPADGIAGPTTFLALSSYREPTETRIGEASMLDLKETKLGGISSIGGIGAATAADKIEDTAEKLAATDGLMHMLANTLYIVGAILVLMGVLVAAWGWLKERTTDAQNL